MSATETTSRAGSAAESGCGILFARIARMSGQGLGRSLDALGMSGHEFAILHRLEQGGSAHGRELSRTLRLHPSNLVALLDQLEVEGLIVRRRDPSDRRRQLIKLTAAGTKRLRRAEAAVAEAERELLSPLSAEERRELYGYLERIAEHACRPSSGWCS
ncbi:MAG: MarR family transcriptional regulator, lower aerobic nicotinate degradation pathway regulator [Solirubrobacterales bacterium]|jgi:DNA-binding MarR family transcriptional regulator|nr:MarR family transcriptional regulator, lower aerobic nicotinate degradation pathway regulator [Solirubrobacterales bacterium]